MVGACAIVDFCGELHTVDPDATLSFGRSGDVIIDDNPYLHRRLGLLVHRSGLWWLCNVGTQIPLAVKDLTSRSQVILAPGREMALSFPAASVHFSAGRSNYELELTVPWAGDRPRLDAGEGDHPGVDGGETISLADLPLTIDQKRLIVALAEATLVEGTAEVNLPSNRAAAHRLGWTITRFNRKLDNVCERLAKAGVSGLRGTAGVSAADRRIRLVEHAVSSGLVSCDDLLLLPG